MSQHEHRILRLASYTPRPKEPRRRDPAASHRKLLADPACRVCGDWASDGHHIVHRSLGGDDVEANIMPLCHSCHMAYHDGASIAPKLETAELLYVGVKMGVSGGREYLARRYGWS